MCGASWVVGGAGVVCVGCWVVGGGWWVVGGGWWMVLGRCWVLETKQAGTPSGSCRPEVVQSSNLIVVSLHPQIDLVPKPTRARAVSCTTARARAHTQAVRI